MLHARTKKVASYGRRAQRVVAVSGDRRFSFNASPDTSVEHLDHENPSHSADEEKDDDNMYTHPAKYSSSKSFKADRKKAQRPEAPLKSQQKAAGKKLGAKGTPIRKPLGSYPPNIPNSPVVPPKLLKARAAAGKGTPLRPRPRKIHNISPYVDVDITVIDDSGRRLSEERRVTKMNVQVNDLDGSRAKPVRRAGRTTAIQTYAILLSEEEDDGEDDEYVPSHKNTNNKRDAKERGSGLSSRDGRDPVQKARRMRASENKSASDRPDSKTLRRSKAPKRTTRIIVLSDSESEVSVTGATGTKEARNAEIGGATNVQPTNAKINGESNDSALKDIPHGQVNPIPRHDVRTYSPTCQKERKVYLGRKSYRSKSALSARTNQSAFTQRGTDQNPPVQERISVEYDSSARPRQLTPIKSSSSKAAFLQQRPVRSSPSRLIVLSDDDTSLSIDDELQLALEVADLELAKPPQPSSRPPVANDLFASKPQRRSEIPHVPSFLRSLLSECGQLAPFNFDAFIGTFPLDPITGFSGHTAVSENIGNGKPFSLFQKVGEASYSEVFGIGNVVLKIVPLLDEDNDVSATWTADWDSPPVSEAKDVLKEIVVTRAMGDICKGFIKLLKAHVVQGSYPKSLLALWDHFDKVKGSESVRPAHFSPLQTYAIIILPNGGPDLENFSFGHANSTGSSGWRQACSIFWQVVQSLGKAEELVHFEHRDLHWGQILVRNTIKTPRFLAYSAHGTIPFDDPSHGIQATIIDLGLSRIDQGQGDSYWTPFTDEIFEGEGDYQYDVYRMMRKHNKDEWRTFKPLTNVMWLHYLTNKLINHKHIPSPVCASSRRSRKSIRIEASPAITDADKRAYECLVEVEQILSSSITSVARSVGVKLPKLSKGTSVADNLHEPMVRVASAADMLRLGKEQKWIL